MKHIYTDFGFDQLAQWMRNNSMQTWANLLPAQVDSGLSVERFGDLKQWLLALEELPNLKETVLSAQDDVNVTCPGISQSELEKLRYALEALIPWRKGPFTLCDIEIDTEWRSDWKWDRLKPHIVSLKGRSVLDVGCGNGYHMWRMLGQQAKRVIGVDPSPRFSVQFEMVKRLAGTTLPIDLVPIPLEAIPRPLEAFDTVFSMGVLYHRRSPIDHLLELKDCLRPGGEIVLESLVINGDEATCLTPEGRYGKMRNVWFIPSAKMMMLWLRKTGFVNVRLANESITSTEEQRSTHWMRFESLKDFLESEDQSKTIEGHPAPMRAIVIAEKQA